jgi:hypothetical protein
MIFSPELLKIYTLKYYHLCTAVFNAAGKIRATDDPPGGC